MMTPGDFASLQEGREGLSTEDYIAWKLPYVSIPILNYDSNNSILTLWIARKKTQTTTTSRSP